MALPTVHVMPHCLHAHSHTHSHTHPSPCLTRTCWLVHASPHLTHLFCILPFSSPAPSHSNQMHQSSPCHFPVCLTSATPCCSTLLKMISLPACTMPLPAYLHAAQHASCLLPLFHQAQPALYLCWHIYMLPSLLAACSRRFIAPGVCYASASLPTDCLGC